MGKVNLDKKLRKKRRIGSKIKGSADCPRISVFRSNRYIYTQAIDDEKRVTIVASSSQKMVKAKKIDQAKQVGLELAKKLLEKNIKKAVFDRNVYVYKGRVKAVAEGLREGGIEV
ncbi:MAG: 50S ribosomal protein L18 [Patescibacteria group bacterium]|nr:MAG: 50S ribosomal protein L18 [Patescibacteria group bacterium]